MAMYKILEYNNICNMFGTSLKIIYWHPLQTFSNSTYLN